MIETSLLDENSALKDELRDLKKENLYLNEHILFDNKKKTNNSQSQSRGRSRSRSRSRSNSRRRRQKLHNAQNVKSLQDDPEQQVVEEENLMKGYDLSLPNNLKNQQHSLSDESNADQKIELQNRRKIYQHPTKGGNAYSGDEDSSSVEIDEEDADEGSSEYSYVEGDSYFQETINRLLKENILLKRSHKAYERCHKELEEECEEHKMTIKQLQDDLLDEQEKRKQVEADYIDLQKSHIALEQAHVELDYGMKKMLEDNVDMRKNLSFLQTSKDETDNMKRNLPVPDDRSSFRKTLDKLSFQTDNGKRRVPPKRPDPPTRPTSSAYSSAGERTPIPAASNPNPSSTHTPTPFKPVKPPPFANRKDVPGPSKNAKSAPKKPVKLVKKVLYIFFSLKMDFPLCANFKRFWIKTVLKTLKLDTLGNYHFY